MTMVDRWIGRVLDRIDSIGIGDETAIVFTTDHGFNFGERGGQFGKMIAGEAERGERRWLRSPLHREIVEIPMLISIPGVEPRQEHRLSGAIDVAPTIADMFGIEAQEWMQGRSLLDYVTDADAAEDEIIVSAMPLGVPGRASVSVVDDVTRSIVEWQPITVTVGKWVLLFATWDDPIELYDSAADPDWLHNLADVQPDMVRDIHAKMVAELRRIGTNDEQLEARS